jgi:hypothetical protein
MTSYESSFNNYSSADANFKNMKDQMNNPTGSDKKAVSLNNFKPGVVRVFRTMIHGIPPIEVNRLKFSEGQTTLYIDSKFIGIVVGEPKDQTKKYQIEYIGYSEADVKEFQEREKLKNKK